MGGTRDKSGVLFTIFVLSSHAMRILFLAPQPFFQDRGTPIAVRLAVQVLATRKEDSIDLLTYHEGTDISIPNVNHIRIKAPFFLNNIAPGISVKKLFCDIIFLFTALKLVWKNRKNPYDLVHAVEESVFIAMLIKVFWKIPYIYDMDSSIAQQLTEKWRIFRPFLPLLSFLEGRAIKHSMAVVPVCDALAAIAYNQGSQDTQILRDISLLGLDNSQTTSQQTLREELNIPPDSLVILYVGNLEPYQGCGLLIDAFAKIAHSFDKAHLVIIGGSDEHISAGKTKISALNLSDRAHLAGRRAVNRLKSYLLQADILASPRLRGNNTPMKIYSYLHSGKAIIATNLPTHTQVLNNTVSILTDPTPDSYAQGLKKLISDPDLRHKIGNAAHELAEERYTFEIFQRDLNSLYDRIDSKILTT
ncbi:MAG: glycosyltransferase family 4 protein [Bdellovibrionota bacterium]